MTVAEVKVALLFNSLVKVKTDKERRVFACAEVTAFAAVHNKGQKITVRVECRGIVGNCVYCAPPEDLTLEDWRAPDDLVQKLLNEEAEKQKTERILKI